MKTSVALILLTCCGFVVCVNNRNYINSLKKRWNPLISIDIDVQPVVLGYKPGEANPDVADDYEDISATPSPTPLQSALEEKLDEDYFKKIVLDALSDLDITNPPATATKSTKSTKKKSNSLSSTLLLSQLPARNIEINQAPKSGSVSDSSISDVSLTGSNISNGRIDSTPMDTSSLKVFRNKDLSGNFDLNNIPRNNVNVYK